MHPWLRAPLCLTIALVVGLTAASPALAQSGEPDSVEAEPGRVASERAASPDATPEATAVGQRPTEAETSINLGSADDSVDRNLIGKAIGRIEFGCDLSACADPSNLEEFKTLSGIYVGQSYSLEAMARAQQRLAKTGFFSSFDVRKELVEGTVFIDIQATGAVLVRDVTFGEIDTPPFRSDLEKVLVYRQGQAFSGSVEKANSQVDALQALYEREGYFGTSIEVVPTPLADRPNQIDIKINIDKGPARRVCDVGMRGVSAMPFIEAREYLIGLGSFLARRLSIFETNFTSKGFREGQQNLIEEYRRRGYFQARIVDKAVKFEQDNCVTLVVDIVEGPHWDLEFEGAEQFASQDLIEELPFFESGYVDAEEIRRAERAIAKLYETSGYPFTRVTGREVTRDRLDRLIQFEIEEGPRLEIREIVFEGVSTFEEAELVEVMSTRAFALFDTGGYVQTDELLADFGRIENLYREKGYNRAAVVRFSLEILEDGEGLRVHILVDEGVPTVVQRVDVDGNRILPDGTLIQSLTAGPDAPFVPLAVRSDQSKLIQRYAELGHPLAKVNTRCFLLTGEKVICEAPRLPRGCLAKVQEDLAGRCEWTDDARTNFVCERRVVSETCEWSGGALSDKVRITHEVSEGPFVRVGVQLLKGNFETRRSVIYREVPMERGDPLDTQKIIAAQGNMRQLNVFDSVNINTIGLDEGVMELDSAQAALLINVEEAQTEFLDFRFGFELREPFVDDRQLLLTGEVQYTNRNLFGLAQGLQPRMIGAIDTLQILRNGFSNSAPGSPGRIDTLDFLFGVEVLYSHPRLLKDLFGIDKLYFTLAPFYLMDLLGIVNRNLLREEWGVRTEFRKNLSELLDRLFFKLGIEFKQIATFASDGTILDDGTRIFSPRRTQGKLEPDAALDRRDSPLNPTKGFFIRGEPTLISGDALGKGGESFVGDAFLRLRLSGSYFIPFWRGDLVLAQALKVGQVFPLFGRETPIPDDERFYLGGVRSVRGFVEDSLGPVNDNQVPTGGEFFLNYNAELRYPILPQFGVFGATFFDAGLLADCFVEDADGNSSRTCYEDAFGDDFPGNIRTTAGLGLRVLIFDQIPIVLDYGIILNRKPGERFGQIHLNVGYTFD